MYRYYLFFIEYYYPSGGMKDCILKTNNFDELVPFIHEHYTDDWYQAHITYYDALEDKHFIANMEWHKNEDGFDRWRFVKWEEEEND